MVPWAGFAGPMRAGYWRRPVPAAGKDKGRVGRDKRGRTEDGAGRSGSEEVSEEVLTPPACVAAQRSVGSSGCNFTITMHG